MDMDNISNEYEEYKAKREEGIENLRQYNQNTFNLINEKYLLKAASLFQDSINKSPNEEESYKSSIYLEETYEKLLSGISTDYLKYQDVFNQYMHYSLQLMNIISNNIKYSLKFNDLKHEFYQIIAVNLIKDIPLKHIGTNAYDMIEYFKSFEETYYLLISTLMRHYFNYGFNIYNSEKIIESKNIFFSINDIFKHYKLDDNLNTLNINLITKDEINDVIESANFYIKRIDAEILIKKGDEKLNSALNESDEIDMDDVTESLTYYRNALNEISKSTFSQDIELEAICFSNIAKIMYRIFKNKKKRNKIKGYVMQSVNLGLSLMPKNVGKEKWYIEATNILQEIRNEEEKEERKNDDNYRREMKKKKEQIFNELNEKKLESNLSFIKFILKKYPYKGYTNISESEIEEEFQKDNRNFVKTLVVKYHPDRYPKGTDEEKEYFVIIHEISIILNGMYSIYDNMRKDA